MLKFTHSCLRLTWILLSAAVSGLAVLKSLLYHTDTKIETGSTFQWGNGGRVHTAGDNVHRNPCYLPARGRPSRLLQDRSSTRHQQDAWQRNCKWNMIYERLDYQYLRTLLSSTFHPNISVMTLKMFLCLQFTVSTATPPFTGNLNLFKRAIPVSRGLTLVSCEVITISPSPGQTRHFELVSRAPTRRNNRAQDIRVFI